MDDNDVAGLPRKRGLLIRLPWRYIGPGVVFAGVGLLLGLSSYESLRPVPLVDVMQVLSVSAAREEESQEVQSAESESVQTMVQAPGWIEPEPYAVAAASLTDGTIAEILVLEGDAVRAGQVVARLIDTDAAIELRSAEARKRALDAEVDLSRASLSAAEETFAEAVEATRAAETAKAVFAELEARLLQLPSQIRQASAELDARVQEAARVRGAAESGSASEIELILAEAAVEAQSALVESLERQGGILEAQRDRAFADLRAARRNLELRTVDRLQLESARAEHQRSLAALEQAAAELDAARLRVERMEIHSPIDGLVLRRFKSPGDKVMLGMDDARSSQILLVYDPNRLQVRADVPLADASHIRLGQRCEIISEILPDRVFAGEVIRITNEADLQRNTLQFKIRIVEPHPLLKPEVIARVRFMPGSGGRTLSTGGGGDEAQARVMVPARAISVEDGRPSVLAIRDRRGLRGKTQRVWVTTSDLVDGSFVNDWITVSGGLLPTDLVVVSPASVGGGRAVSYRLTSRAEWMERGN